MNGFNFQIGQSEHKSEEKKFLNCNFFSLPIYIFPTMKTEMMLVGIYNDDPVCRKK